MPPTPPQTKCTLCRVPFHSPVAKQYLTPPEILSSLAEGDENHLSTAIVLQYAMDFPTPYREMVPMDNGVFLSTGEGGYGIDLLSVETDMAGPPSPENDRSTGCTPVFHRSCFHLFLSLNSYLPSIPLSSPRAKEELHPRLTQMLLRIHLAGDGKLVAIHEREVMTVGFGKAALERIREREWRGEDGRYMVDPRGLPAFPKSIDPTLLFPHQPTLPPYPPSSGPSISPFESLPTLIHTTILHHLLSPLSPPSSLTFFLTYTHLSPHLRARLRAAPQFQTASLSLLKILLWPHRLRGERVLPGDAALGEDDKHGEGDYHAYLLACLSHPARASRESCFDTMKAYNRLLTRLPPFTPSLRQPRTLSSMLQNLPALPPDMQAAVDRMMTGVGKIVFFEDIGEEVKEALRRCEPGRMTMSMKGKWEGRTGGWYHDMEGLKWWWVGRMVGGE